MVAIIAFAHILLSSPSFRHQTDTFSIDLSCPQFSLLRAVFKYVTDCSRLPWHEERKASEVVVGKLAPWKKCHDCHDCEIPSQVLPNLQIKNHTYRLSNQKPNRPDFVQNFWRTYKLS